MSVSAVCPGSFDPFHNGHLDVVERAAARFDRVVVAVLVNESKKGLFDIDQRIDLIRRTTAHLHNVEVDSFRGLLVDFCHAQGIDLICKGLRAVSDFEYELQMAQMNAALSPGLDTMFVTAKPSWAFLSSSLVKQVARYGGSVDGLVPEGVSKALVARQEGGGS